MASLPRVSPSSFVKTDFGTHSPQSTTRKFSTANQQPTITSQMDPPSTTGHDPFDHVAGSDPSEPQSQLPLDPPGGDNLDALIPGAFPTDATLSKMEEKAQAGPPSSTSKALKDTAEALYDYAMEFVSIPLEHYYVTRKNKWNEPSMEEPSASNVGVSSVPGGKREASAGLLPDERPPKDKKLSSEQSSRSEVDVDSLPGRIQVLDITGISEKRSRSITPKGPESDKLSPKSTTTDSEAESTPSPATSPEIVDERVGIKEPASPIAGKVNFPDASPSSSGFYFHGRRKGSYDLPGRKEPHPTPYQYYDVDQFGYDQMDVSSEEVEARLQQGVTPKTLKKEITLSDISDIEEELRQLPGPSAARRSGYINEPSASNARYSDTTVPPHRSYSPIRGTSALTPSNGTSRDTSSGFGIDASPPVRTFSPEPIIARAVPSTAEPPPKVYSNIQDVGGFTDTKPQTIERSTQPEWRGECGPAVTGINWEAETSGQDQSTTTRTDQFLDTQPIGAACPHEGPRRETSASPIADETTTPEGSNGEERVRQKGKEERRGGEKKSKEGEHKPKTTILKKMFGMFHRKSTKRGSTDSFSASPCTSDDHNGRSEEMQEEPPEHSSSITGETETVLSDRWNRQRPFDMPPAAGAQEFWLNDERGTSCLEPDIDQSTVPAVSQSPVQPRQERRRYQLGSLGFHPRRRIHCINPYHQPLS